MNGYPTQQEPGPSSFDSFLTFAGEWWWKILLILAVLMLLSSAVEIVSQKTALIIEKFGKYDRVMHAGLHFRIPVIEQVVKVMSLQLQQIREDVKVKTSDNVFVTLPVAVQYRVQADKVKEAHYELEEPEKIIVALVLNDIKSTAAEMPLEAVFKSRDQLEQGVKSTLVEKLGSYGYEVDTVVVDNPMLSPELEASFNNVTAAQREQDAATAQAEALRIRQVGEARANAEGLKINAEAQVAYRNTIAEGNADAILKMKGETNLDESEILRFFMVTDGNDAIRDASHNSGTTIVVASPSHTDGLYAALPRAPINGSVRT